MDIDSIDFQNPYSILGVPFDATDDVIKASYRSRALRWHPDKHPEDPDKWTTIFQKLSLAYACLQSSTDRHIYDTTGHWTGDPQEGGDDFAAYEDINELFQDLFANGGGGASYVFSFSAPPPDIMNSGNLFSMLGSMGMGMGGGGFESMISQFVGDPERAENIADLLTRVLEPMKERAQETITKIKEQNATLQREYDEWKQKKEIIPEHTDKKNKVYAVRFSLQELWNNPANTPRKKRIQIGETKQVVHCVLGVNNTTIEGEYIQGEWKGQDSSSSWIWKWTTNDILNTTGYVVYQQAKDTWELLGVYCVEREENTDIGSEKETQVNREWFCAWKSKDDCFVIVWHGTGESPQKLNRCEEEANFDWSWMREETPISEGRYFWRRPALAREKNPPDWHTLLWHPSPFVHTQGEGWWMPDQGAWVCQDGEYRRSAVWISLPRGLPSVKEVYHSLEAESISEIEFEMGETFGFFPH